MAPKGPNFQDLVYPMLHDAEELDLGTWTICTSSLHRSHLGAAVTTDRFSILVAPPPPTYRPLGDSGILSQFFSQGRAI